MFSGQFYKKSLSVKQTTNNKLASYNIFFFMKYKLQVLHII